MIEADKFMAHLKVAGVDFSCGVPDSLLKSFCACLTETEAENHVITANEGGAIDADVEAAGPIYLQGDHSDADYKNMILRPAI